jgi:hypothetical protein
LGPLEIRSSCFIDNVFFHTAPVNLLGSQFVSEDNFGTPDSDLLCEFIAFFKDIVEEADGHATCTDYDSHVCLSDIALSSTPPGASTKTIALEHPYTSSNRNVDADTSGGAAGRGSLSILLVGSFVAIFGSHP